VTAPLSLNRIVQHRWDIGIVRQVFGSGYAYKVELLSGEVLLYAAGVLREAPENVLLFPKKSMCASRSRGPATANPQGAA